jgi:hypothetical protein
MAMLDREAVVVVHGQPSGRPRRPLADEALPTLSREQIRVLSGCHPEVGFKSAAVGQVAVASLPRAVVRHATIPRLR